MSTAKQVLILGGGFGGLASANLLRKSLPRKECQITVIEKNQYFIMGIVNLWILSGSRRLEDSQIPLNKLEGKGIRFLNDEITGIDPSENSITTARTTHNKLEYDYLIVALGAELAPELIDGFDDYGNCFNVYDGHQVPSLREKILSLKVGRIVICIADIPYKCPPAPYEVSLLINDMLIKNGTRNSIDLDVYGPTPISLPVAGANVSRDVVNLLNDNHVMFHPLHKIKKVLDKKTVEFENGNKTSYDLLIVIPPHQVPQVIKNSELLRDGAQRWINVDRFTLRTKYKNVFAIGDVTEIRLDNGMTIPKAGIFAEGEAKVVSQQIIDEIKNNKSGNNSKTAHTSKFDGKGFCFMEAGDKKAGYIDADFYNEGGPTIRLDPPSDELYQKKLDFVNSRLNEWFM
ncbi:MAG TPA: FAD/NAD(P)-binding oxidoreductase [Nitrososphaeraceae archaeon]|nr:FAD/NAD(P)-binding oxidoreductase [Nitrososphaeraceae archaeon]